MKKIFLLFLLSIIGIQIALCQIQISGIITSSEDGLGVPGSAVVVKGTTIGTTADIDGHYKLTIPQDAKILLFSFVGLKSQEVPFTGQTTINIILGTDIFKLEEVIVAGVASATPKRKLSVSVTKVGSDQLEEVPATSAATALQGKVSGITIVSGGGPGQSVGIRLRSSTSLLGGQSPLIIVDGIMLEGELADINVDDIDAMEVVKGAAASALYGSRAGSGVINIRTKRGKLSSEGTTEVRFRNEYGISQLAKEIKLAEHHPYRLTDDYQQLGYTKYFGVTYPEGYNGGGNNKITGSRALDFDHYSDNPYSFTIDPQKEIFLDGNFYTNYLSIISSGVKTSFMLSFENNHNSGIVFSKRGSNRQSIRVNIDHMLNEKIKISSSTNIIDTKLDQPNEGSASAFYDLLFMNPDINLDADAPLSDSTFLKEYYIKPDNWSISGNPKHALFHEKIKTKKFSVLQNFNASLNLLKWLVANIDYSLEKRNNEFTLFMPVGYMSPDEKKRNGSFGKQNGNGLSQTFSSTINVNKTLGEFTTKGKLSYIFEKSEESSSFGIGDSLLTTGIRTLNAVTERIKVSSSEFATKAKNYSAIVDFDYKGKYMASVLYRLDGSSLFGANNRWNPYYRYSLAYRLSEDIKINNIQELKLRFAVGTSGQRPGFDYQYETFVISNGQYIPYSSGNKDLKPSETKETEFGINIQFFERFETEITLSSNDTKGAFVPVPLPASTGFQAKWSNAATLSGSSFEWSVSAQVLKTSDWEWRMNLSFDHIRQKVSELTVPPFFNGPRSSFYLKKGETFGVMYGNDWVRSLDQMKNQLANKKVIGDYTVNSEGYVIAKATEGTLNEKPILLKDAFGQTAFVKIADMNPDFNMSLNSSLTWKNLTLTMLWSWKNGGQIYNFTRQNLYLDKRHGDFDQSGKEAYKKKSIDYYYGFYNGLSPNTYFVEDGTYLKLRELAISYSTKKGFSGLKTIKFLKGAKFSFLARNLLTFTKYTGWDPEVASGGDLTNYAFDDFGYPNYRSYTVSLELRF